MFKQHLFFMLCMLLLLIPIHAEEEKTVFEDYEAMWSADSIPEQLEAANRLIESYPDWAEPYMRRILLSRASLYYLNYQKDTEGMEAAWQDILDNAEIAHTLLPEPDYELLWQEGLAYWEQKNLEVSAPIFQQLFELRPHTLIGNYVYGAYLDGEQYDEAKVFFEQLLRTQPYFDARFGEGYAANELFPDEDNLRYHQLMDSGLGHAYEHRFDEALEDYQAAYKLAQQSDAITTFREAFALFHIVHAERWLNYFEDSNRYSEEAERHNRTVIELAPDWDFPYIELAKLLDGDEQLDEALRVLDEGIMLIPDSASLYLQRAHLNEELGNDAQANNDYYQYTSLSREHLIDWSIFDAINQTIPLYSESHWHHHFTIEANAGDILSVGFGEPFHKDGFHEHPWVISLVDADGVVIDSIFHTFSPDDLGEQLLLVTISTDGNYHLVAAATEGGYASKERLIISLE